MTLVNESSKDTSEEEEVTKIEDNAEEMQEVISVTALVVAQDLNHGTDHSVMDLGEGTSRPVEDQDVGELKTALAELTEHAETEMAETVKVAVEESGEQSETPGGETSPASRSASTPSWSEAVIASLECPVCEEVMVSWRWPMVCKRGH